MPDITILMPRKYGATAVAAPDTEIGKRWIRQNMTGPWAISGATTFAAESADELADDIRSAGLVPEIK